ncbi:MAG: hypothetical protein M3Z14_03950 [Candidatus Eremiobacteraeota bacterium]|nr:hypothetical protein [Candidatus Eremiobacteraeota bacterium]
MIALKTPDEKIALRHLLHDLDNPNKLEKNYLTRQYFSKSPELAEGVRLRSIVLAAVSTLLQPDAKQSLKHCTRQHAIITKYDIEGTSRDVLTSELKIGVRKFYYERRTGLNRLLDMLKKQSVTLTRVEDLPSTFYTTLDYAASLQELGEFDKAIHILRGLARSANHRIDRPIAQSKLIHVLCDCGRIGEAVSILSELRSTVNSESLSEPDILLLKANCAFATLAPAYATGKISDALCIALEARSALFDLQRVSDMRTSLLFQLVPRYLGDIQTLLGDAAQAVRSFQEALSASNRCDRPSNVLFADVLSGLAWAYANIPGKIGLARETNGRALDVANRYGAFKVVAQAQVNYCLFDYWRGDFQNALRHIGTAHSIAGLVHDDFTSKHISLLYARIAAANGRFQLGFSLLRNARAALAPGTYMMFFSQLVEAQILAWSGSYAAALETARIVVRAAGNLGNTCITGLAKLLIAQIEERLGNLRSAREAIVVAIVALEKSAAPYSLGQAYLCSGRLTRNVNHKRLARDLQLELAQ